MNYPIFLDNIIFSLQSVGGISAYWAQLLSRMQTLGDRVFLLEYRGAENNIFRKNLSIDDRNMQYISVGYPAAVARYSPLSTYIPCPAIFHSSYYRVSLLKHVANIVTVHDFIYERFRRGVPMWVHCFQKRVALRMADGIICVSENTRRDMFHFYPWLTSKDVKVIYHGVSDVFGTECRVEGLKGLGAGGEKIMGRKYVIFIGSRTSYKNFDIAVETLSVLPDYWLVIVGGGVLSHEECTLLRGKLPGRFLHFDGVSDAHLNVLYQNAFCLLYPSSYEGFGLPVIEAMKAGCPVVAVRTSALLESCGNAALLSDSPDPAEFMIKIKLLENNAIRKDCIRKGLYHAKKFSWDRCYGETVAFYDRIFQKKFGNSFEMGRSYRHSSW